MGQLLETFKGIATYGGFVYNPETDISFMDGIGFKRQQLFTYMLSFIRALISVLFFGKLSSYASYFSKLKLSRHSCLLWVVMRAVKLLTAEGYLLNLLHFPLNFANPLVCCFIRSRTLCFYLCDTDLLLSIFIEYFTEGH